MVSPTDITIIEDTSEVDESALIQEQLDQSVQEFPDAVNNKGGTLGWGTRDLFQRKAILWARGTYERLRRQYAMYYHEDNSMFRDAIAGLTKRVQSLPYEIKAPDEHGDRWDNFIRFSGFKNWETFLSKLIVPYSIYDIGAFIEIIAPGDPLKAPTAAATGIAILDSRRCTPTGDPMFPVIYISSTGKQHLLHRSRVIQLVDMEDENEDLLGWGDSALSRCITPIFREILMAQYMRASLDDMPAPGFAVAKNLTEQQVMEQVARMKEKRENDQDMLGRLVFLFGADTSQTPSLEFTQFQKEFSGFDPDKLANMNAKYIAGGVGLDVQDFWELTGSGMGTATQSEILDQKSKGRALGRLIKGIERMINDVFPDDVEFAFKYRNEEEDLERAQTAQAWATTLVTLGDILTPDEKRIVAANNIDAVKDAITDEQGNILKWDDVDPQTIGQAMDIGDVMRLMGQTEISDNGDGSEEGKQPASTPQTVSGESIITANKLVIDQMNRAMVDVFTAAQMLGNKNPAEELRGMFWVGNQLVPQNQLQNIWKYGTLIAPSTTNADLIVDSEPAVLEIDESAVTTPTPSQSTIPAVSGTRPPAPPDEETPDENFDAPVEKDYRRTAASFKRAFGDVITRLGKGQFTTGGANVLLLNELRKGGREAMLDGLKRAGLKSPEIDKQGEKALALWLTKQRPFLKSFVADVKGGKFTEKELSNKGLQWANGSLSDMLFKGMELGAPRKKWRWVINFLKENCVSCLALNGQVHTMKAYANKGLLPRSVKLVCHGDFCGCSLKSDDGPAKGRLGAVRFVRRSLSIFDKARMN